MHKEYHSCDLFHKKHIHMIHCWKCNFKICNITIYSNLSFSIMTFVYFSCQGRSFMLTAFYGIQKTYFWLFFWINVILLNYFYVTLWVIPIARPRNAWFCPQISPWPWNYFRSPCHWEFQNSFSILNRGWEWDYPHSHLPVWVYWRTWNW